MPLMAAQNWPAGQRSQAAEPLDLVADLVAVLVAPALADESDDVDEDESEEELPESGEDVEPCVEPESRCDWLLELLAGLPFRRESLRESLR
jgi:hypothetical protein